MLANTLDLVLPHETKYTAAIASQLAAGQLAASPLGHTLYPGSVYMDRARGRQAGDCHEAAIIPVLKGAQVHMGKRARGASWRCLERAFGEGTSWSVMGQGAVVPGCTRGM